MKTEEFWKQYQNYTRDLTEHSRKLGFAGVAVCWVFRSSDYTFPTLIYWSIGFFVAYFIFDILHYLLGAVLTKRYIQKEEFRLFQETGSIDGDVLKPRWLDWPSYTFFITKAVVMIVGFVFIAFELFERMGK